MPRAPYLVPRVLCLLTLCLLRTHIPPFSVLEPSSALFSVAGLKQSTFTVLPSAKHSIRLRLVPLQCGQLQLPRLQLRQLPAGLLLFEPSDAGAVFVYPSEKAR